MDVYKIVGKLLLEGKEAFDRDVEDTQKKGSNLAAGIGRALEVGAKVGTAAFTAAKAIIGKFTKDSIANFAEYEQLAGGVQKIFESMDTSRILQDAANAYRDLGMTANEYLAIINDVGASFAATMGAEAGYEAAQRGLTAISDYASGTGKNFSELQQKLALITRSTSSYQSIADQFSGILPATSAGFLEQAQAAGILSESYKTLTDVPIEEYQMAVTEMLALGVDALGLTGNTAAEATETISGSLTMLKASWQNLLTGLADENADMDTLISNLATSAETAALQLAPRITQILGGMGNVLTQLAPVIANAIPMLVTDILPSLAAAGVQLLQSFLDVISQNLDFVVASGMQILMMLVDVLVDNLPLVTSAAFQIITALIAGIAERAPELIPAIVDGIVMAWAALVACAPDFLEAGIMLIDNIGQGLANAFAALFPQVAPWVQEYIFQPIRSVFTVAVDLGREIVSNLWAGLRDFANTLFPGLGDLLTGYTEDAVQQSTDVVLSSGEQIPSDAETPVSAIAEVMENDTSMEDAAVEAVDRSVTAMSDAISVSGFDTAGQEGMQKFIDGINSMESAVLATVDRIASKAVQRLQSALQSVQSMANSASIDGSNADGLNYVPFDGYISELHKGEAVLTAAEAAVWRAGKASGEASANEPNQQTGSHSGITIVQNIQTVPQTPVEFAAATEAYFEQARWAMA